MRIEECFIIVGEVNGKTKYVSMPGHHLQDLTPDWTENFLLAHPFQLEQVKEMLHSAAFSESKSDSTPDMVSKLVNSEPSKAADVKYRVYLARPELQQCIYNKSGVISKVV